MDGKNEKMLQTRTERRLLSQVPDLENMRSCIDRRGSQSVSCPIDELDYPQKERLYAMSIRYLGSFDVIITSKAGSWQARAVDISTTGILVEFPDQNYPEAEGEYQLTFELSPGIMPEGFEAEVNARGVVARNCQGEDGQRQVAFVFQENLFDYFQKKRWGRAVQVASSFLFISALIVVLMRVESVVYFRYNMFLYLYSLIAATFLLSRYFFGALYRDFAINPDFTPGVSIIIPCFNEEEWIQRTILSCLNQDYPIEKLEVIVADDFSTDNSLQKIRELEEELKKQAVRYQIGERLTVLEATENGGKRKALCRGVSRAKHDLVVFVDSDSFLEPTAIRNLVQPFQDPKMGGVAGRTDVANRFTNWLTKMQTVRYYIAFRVMKASEAYFDTVSCLSGPLSCYRKELVEEHMEAWLNQKFLGHPATFGDDRSMTNFILKNHRTSYQDRAICSTIVPSDLKMFLRQQMRWKRSWLRESLRAGSFIWRKEPFAALFFYIGFVVPVLAPVVVVYNLLYIPLTHQVFPGTFLMGLLLMSLLMSFSYLFFNKSKLWIFGLVFSVFYEFVLLWQMPIAWFTFWKSTWGTRATPQDLEAKQRSRRRRTKMNRTLEKVKAHFK